MADTSPTSDLKQKDKVSAKVIKTTIAGAVVDIGRPSPAVIPISQLRREPVRRVDEVLKEGDVVDAWVSRTPKDQEHIELTLIEPLGLEWRDVKKGMTLTGKVSKLEKFGAFVELGTERPGLVHISEMSHDYVRSPEDAVKLGEEVEVQVLGVDKRKKQIKLSMKALQPQAKEIMAEEAAKDEPAPTAMEMALRKAMDKEESPAAAPQTEGKPQKQRDDMENILSRTLENRVKSK